MNHWHTLSNLAFIAAGLYVLTTTSVIWGVGVILMGVGSFHGHATGYYKYDWLGIFTAYSFQLAHYARNPLVGALIFLLLLALIIYYQAVREFRIKGGIRGTFIVAGMLYAATLVASFFVVDYRIAMLSAAIYGLAFSVRNNVDHGLWHVMVAGAIMVLVL